MTRLTRSFSAAQTGPSAPSVRARCNRVNSEEFARKIRPILALCSFSGAMSPAMTHSSKQARYSSSSERPLLHSRHAGAAMRFSGYGSSKRTFDGTSIDGFAWPAAMHAEPIVSVVAVASQLLHLACLRSCRCESRRVPWATPADFRWYSTRRKHKEKLAEPVKLVP